MPGHTVGEKIKKLRREGKSQDQSVAIAKSMERRGELKGSPPQGVVAFENRPDAASSPGQSPAQGFDPLPDPKTIKHAPAAPDSNKPNIGASRPGAVDSPDPTMTFARGDRNAGVKSKTKTSGQGSKPAKVQSFSEGV